MKYFEKLKEFILLEDFESTNAVIELIIEEDDSIEYVNAILTLMEEYPDIDYGMPGPAVHYVERYYKHGYEELLYTSITRVPTSHTLWMLNRILNSPTLVNKEKYLDVLHSVSLDSSLSETIRNDASHYWNYQNQN